MDAAGERGADVAGPGAPPAPAGPGTGPGGRPAGGGRGRGAWVNVLLFLATVATTTAIGGAQAAAGGELDLRAIAVAGAPFSAAIVGILLAHEMGHWLLARAGVAPRQ